MMEAVRQEWYPGTRMKPAEDLITRVRKGDSEAFRSIFDRYARPVMSFIYDMVGRRDLAEELAQETFVRAYKNIGGLRDDARLSSWLFGIAKNVTREHLRSRSRDDRKITLEESPAMEMKDPNVLPEGRVLDKELNGVIRQALAALDDDKRIVFVLKILHEQPYDEIARITGSSIAKLKTDLHRARAEMRRYIRPYLEVSDEM